MSKIDEVLKRFADLGEDAISPSGVHDINRAKQDILKILLDSLRKKIHYPSGIKSGVDEEMLGYNQCLIDVGIVLTKAMEE